MDFDSVGENIVGKDGGGALTCTNYYNFLSYPVPLTGLLDSPSSDSFGTSFSWFSCTIWIGSGIFFVRRVPKSLEEEVVWNKKSI